MHANVQPPAERFNFAQHLIEQNAAHPNKPAFIDDAGALSYGELADRIRRMASALQACG
ncbi:MAG: benzoate-CoA ligase family protein, partial [Hylemonella sp.]|nr:benzoate-CoA ligase family protein [Hylemonella sp.]